MIDPLEHVRPPARSPDDFQRVALTLRAVSEVIEDLIVIGAPELRGPLVNLGRLRVNLIEEFGALGPSLMN